MGRFLRGSVPVWAVAAALVAAVVPTAGAQYMSDFESLTASAAGTLLTGQDGYYVPVAGSLDYNVYTYAGNALAISQNPVGGNQFVAGVSTGTFARAQRTISYGAGTGVWTAGVDICAVYGGAATPTNNIGSLSLQPSGAAKYFIALARWPTATTATSPWNADYVYFNAASAQVTASVPDPGFQGLSQNVWHRWETDFSFDSNRILEVRVRNLSTGATARHNPTEWYLFGGSAGGAVIPTDFRFFTGGGAGNTLAWDNVSIRPRPQIGADHTSLDPVTTTVTFTVTDGPASGVALFFAALSAGPPLYGFPSLDSEPVWLNLGSVFPLFSAPLTPAGSLSVPLSYATPGLNYEAYLQGFVVPAPSGIEVTNSVALGQNQARGAAYDHKTGFWAARIGSAANAGNTLDVARVSAAGVETLVASTPVPASGIVALTGTISPRLGPGEKLRFKLNGVTYREFTVS